MVGGGEIYAQTLPLAERVEWTEVDLEPEGDAFFPPLDPAAWRQAVRQDHPRNPEAGDEAAYAFVTYERITKSGALC